MRLRDWVCAGCHAINLGQRQSCFSCGAVKCANARAATRQVTEIDEAGPPPRMTDTSAAGLHLASTDAACNAAGSGWAPAQPQETVEALATTEALGYVVIRTSGLIHN